VSHEALVPALGAPTAAGKSAVALDLAARFDLEIVTADAMQVYRGMDIGTAKPTAAQRARVPHHVIDVVDPGADFSVADWVRHAEAAIADIRARGKTPFVVGGTGFYLRALSSGLPTVPAADPAVQAEIWEEHRAGGLEPLLRELRDASPRDADRTQRNPRRVVRAVEILRRTGRAPVTFPFTEPAYTLAKVALVPEMHALQPRIEARTERMFAAGLVEEVERLLAAYPNATTAMQAIGYKEVVEHLRGAATHDEAKAAVTLATTQYAKRQRTWFRKEPGATRYEALAPEVADVLADWLGACSGAGASPG
jgi:tRNA dimethylallyltransferase